MYPGRPVVRPDSSSILLLSYAAKQYALLEFLEIPGKCRKLAVGRMVLASVMALYFMHQVRFGGLYGRRKVEADHHSNTSDFEATDDEELRTTLHKQRQRIFSRVAVVPASRPSNNNSKPIPANTARSVHTEKLLNQYEVMTRPAHWRYTTAPVMLAKKLQTTAPEPCPATRHCCSPGITRAADDNRS